MTRVAFLMASFLLPFPAAAATFVLGSDGSPATPPPPQPAASTHHLPAFQPPPPRTDFTIPPGFAPAPVPNLDLRGPSVTANDGSPHVSGSLFATPGTSGVNSGYMFGSQYSTDLERRRPGVTNVLAPTLNLKIPLQ